jgi:ubiquinone/menaquinone biosynthesis C-methylase UbiE
MSHPTQNQRGFTYQLTHVAQAFIDFAAQATLPVVDIGAAYGVATLPLLEKGASVVAIDLSQDHLDQLSVNVAEADRERLTLLNGRFPDITLPTTPVAAVYLSQVLPFLTPDEVREGARVLYNWLAPKGKVFVVSFTPYLAHVADYIPVYEEKKAAGLPFAGFVDDLSRYCSDDYVKSQLPNQINHVDEDDLRQSFTDAGFAIERLATFGDENDDLPSGIKFDNRERVGMIALKQ